MLFKNSKASIEQCDTHINGPQNPRGSPTAPAAGCFQTPDADTGADGPAARSHVHGGGESENVSQQDAHARISHHHQQHRTQRPTVPTPLSLSPSLSRLSAHTHKHTCTQSLVDWLISPPRSTLTRNSNEIKCHQRRLWPLSAHCSWKTALVPQMTNRGSETFSHSM